MPTSIEITGFTHGGDGVGRLPDGMAVFVPGALPGETVAVDVADRRKRFAFGKLVEVVVPAPERAAPPCPHVAEGCGGCDLQHAHVEAQLALKTRVVAEQLTRIGGVVDPVVEHCLGVSPATGYRNHARLHADSRGRLGFHQQGTHDVVPVDPCLVLAPAAASILASMRTIDGLVGLEVRGHDRTGARAAIVEPGPGGLEIPDADGLDVLLRQADGEIVPFRGTGQLSEQVAGNTYGFDATCFFQANTTGADALVAQVLLAAGDVSGALTWDLYAGVGLLTLPLALAGAEVVAVEGHARSAHWCGVNADAAGVGIDIRDEAVAKFVRGVGADDAPDVVVLDPPRTGAGEQVVEALAAQKPESIVYVACDPASLARDVKALAAHGYKLGRVQPLDLFPMTHHVEVVAVLRR